MTAYEGRATSGTKMLSARMAYYRYVEALGGHYADGSGAVDLETGLERLRTLRREIGARGSDARTKVLLDLRETAFVDEFVHRELSKATRAALGLQEPASTTYLALINGHLEGQISSCEHWFLDVPSALEWLGSF